jgi:hypothetical protein
MSIRAGAICNLPGIVNRIALAQRLRGAGFVGETADRQEPARRSGLLYFAVSAATGNSISALRITRLVAFSVASSNPCPCVIASVGQASTQ